MSVVVENAAGSPNSFRYYEATTYLLYRLLPTYLILSNCTMQNAD
jgi:hypothetical protein